MSIALELIEAVVSSSDTSERSLQKEVGPSEIGGCRRKVWYRLNEQPTTNFDTIRLPSFMGTAIHTKIQEAFERQDLFGERFLLEGEFEAGGLRGHVDMYDKVNKEVVDWKTTKSKNLTYFPSRQQRWQVQVYGYLLEENGIPVETVTLVAVARDGDERDIVYHSEPYSRETALEALSWLDEVKATEYEPAPEKDASFCKDYCGFYDESGIKGCVGRIKSSDELVIEDEAAIKAAADYAAINAQIKVLETQKDSAKAALEGIAGITPDGIKITWSEVAGRKSIDESEVLNKLGYVPTKQGRGYLKLVVK